LISPKKSYFYKLSWTSIVLCHLPLLICREDMLIDDLIGLQKL
jgi:hypothetical protein